MTTALAIASFVALLVGLGLLVQLLRRTGVPGRLDTVVQSHERMERVLREEIARNRQDATTGARELREEVTSNLKGASDSLVRAVAELSQSQSSQLADFSRRLVESGTTTEARLDTLRRAIDVRMASLQESTTKSLHDMSMAGAESAKSQRQELSTQVAALSDGARELREEVTRNLKGASDSLVRAVAELSQSQSTQLTDFSRRLMESGTTTEARLDSSRRAIEERMASLQEATTRSLHDMRTTAEESAKLQRQELGTQMATLSDKNERRLTELRQAVEAKLSHIQADNTSKLEEMRKTVEEKLQGTLEMRLGQSFQLVSTQLEQVHKGLGEMQVLASGVGDLKKVLTNVKARGTWGEVQLGNLLEQVLAPEQYGRNVATRPGSAERVEFAIRLPGPEGKDGQVVWLPIDAKFPVEDYERLALAADAGDHAGVDQAVKGLENRLWTEAQSIKAKYLEPPHTTDFAILFLPTEGLYAEVLRRPGLVERMQREERVLVAGPTTLAALLNSLQMGFRTLAIQKRSSEVWQVLGAVKTEFYKFGEVIDKVKKKLEEASSAVDKASVRSRAITRKLRSVEELPATQASGLLGRVEELLADDDTEFEEPQESARRA